MYQSKSQFVGSRRWLVPIAITLWLMSVASAQGLSADCKQAPDLNCVLVVAVDDLGRISSEPAWLTAAAELAHAANAHGEGEQALSLLANASKKLERLSPTDRVDAQLELASVWHDAGRLAGARRAAGDAAAHLNGIDDAHKRADLRGKLAVLSVELGEPESAVQAARGMSEEDDNFAAYKARTLHDIAPALGRTGDLAGARAMASAITMSIPYYRAVALADVAVVAEEAGQRELSAALFAEAADVARDQEDGYFVAGALRQIGEGLARTGQPNEAVDFFDEAARGARTAETAQERARALSRVATALADFRFYDRAQQLVKDAVSVAETEEGEALRAWAMYEVAGGAAFSGDFSAAREVLAAIPEDLEFSGVSLKSAAQRDVAWGYARHERLSEALDTAQGIVTERERVQAYARILRVMADPEMVALPRYL